MYFSSMECGLKGIVAAKTKDKIQTVHFTQCYPLAVACGVFPAEFLTYTTDGKALTLIEMWENAFDDIFPDLNCYIYTVTDRVKTGENVNGGYSSLHPFEICGVKEVNLASEGKKLLSEGSLIISKFTDCDNEERKKRLQRLEKIAVRYNLHTKSGYTSEIICERLKKTGEQS